ncbi:hypothetical protein ACVGXS_00200, partial [Enterobacter hormaechei]
PPPPPVYNQKTAYEIKERVSWGLRCVLDKVFDVARVQKEVNILIEAIAVSRLFISIKRRQLWLPFFIATIFTVSRK